MSASEIPQRPHLTIVPDASQLAHRVAEDLLAAIVQAQHRQGTAHIVLTGGTVGIALLAEARKIMEENPHMDIDPKALDIWWGDERFLPTGDEERNEQQAKEAWLDTLGLDPSRIHTMGSSTDFSSPEEAAEAYAQELKNAAPQGEELPSFDVLLLGMGPDGHIASLFPETGLVNRQGITTPVRNSPKPPPERVSLTIPAINSARQVWLVVAGEAKAEPTALALASWPATAETADLIPASAARGSQSTRWYLDTQASSRLKEASTEAP